MVPRERIGAVLWRQRDNSFLGMVALACHCLFAADMVRPPQGEAPKAAAPATGPAPATKPALKIQPGKVIVPTDARRRLWYPGECQQRLSSTGTSHVSRSCAWLIPVRLRRTFDELVAAPGSRSCRRRHVVLVAGEQLDALVQRDRERDSAASGGLLGGLVGHRVVEGQGHPRGQGGRCPVPGRLRVGRGYR